MGIDFSFAGGAFTAVSVYAPCVAAQRAAYFTHTLLPSLPTDRQLLVGGDFNCVAGQLDVLGPDSSVLGRATGYYDGFRIAETDRQLFDIWRDRYPDRQTFTRAGSQSSARLDSWLVSEQLRRWISTAPDALDQTAGYPGDHQGVTSQLQAAVPVACHGETASPGLGRAVYPTILEVTFICLLGRPTCKVSSSQIKKKKVSYMEKQFPGNGLCCVSNTPRGFLSLTADIAVIGKIGRYARFFPSPPQEKQKDPEGAGSNHAW